MKIKLLNAVKKIGLNLGINISRVTDIRDLDEFLILVKLVTTNHKLIRVGRDDGGYLIPDDLRGVGECFSPGVSDTADFELEMVNRGIKCYLADTLLRLPLLTMS